MTTNTNTKKASKLPVKLASIPAGGFTIRPRELRNFAMVEAALALWEAKQSRGGY